MKPPPVEDLPRRIDLERHVTRSTGDRAPNGHLTVVWRDWDGILDHPPKMVYLTSVDRGGRKGPHLHLRRNSYFLCTGGAVVFVIRTGDGYKEIKLSESDAAMVYVPRNVASAHVNISDGPSQVLALADLAWRPDDNEMENVEFDGYDWEKWAAGAR